MTTTARAPATRRPQSLWDRVRILLALMLVTLVLAWSTYEERPFIGATEALRRTLEGQPLLPLLAVAELVRQAHYLVSEHWSRWHRSWTTATTRATEAVTDRFAPWTRFRLGRALRWLVLVVAAGYVVARVQDTSLVGGVLALPMVALRSLPLALQLAFGFMFIAVQIIGLFWLLSRGGTDVYFPDDITTRFDDVWGQDAVLEKVRETLIFLEDPEAIEERGGYVPGGLLLWGPPGTGKTLLGQAVAGETGQPFVLVEPGAFNNMFMGVGILKVKSLFRKARKLALRYGGVVLFFDEADALGNRGALAPGGWSQPGSRATPAEHRCSGFAHLDPITRWQLHEASSEPAPPTGLRERFMMMGGGGGMGTLQALLTEMSGLQKPRGFVNRVVRRALGMRPKPPPTYRILIMMATNMPQALDEALLRPGRIDRVYKVGYPSKEGRVRTYRGYLARVEHDLTDDEVDRLATMTPYATGASIKDTVNEALINAIRAGRDRITWGDVIKAKHLKALGPPEQVEYIERERHAVAVHEACHAVIAYRVRQHLHIDLATIEKGGTYLGMVTSIPPEDQFTRWRSEYEADLMVSLASLAGERMFFDGDNTSGVSGDLESATRIATLMEGHWGMGSSVASLSVRTPIGVPLPDSPPPPDLGSRVEAQLTTLLERTGELLAADRGAVLAVAHALERYRTLSGEDVVAVINGRPGPLVDGSVYADPAFAEQLERYHDAAVAAHAGHSRPSLPLPMESRTDQP